MFFVGFRHRQIEGEFPKLAWFAMLLAAPLSFVGPSNAWSDTVTPSESVESSDSVKPKEKLIIGATAEITEVSSGLEFSARVDTGAKSCSLHVEKIEIQDEDPDPLKNVGRPIRFLIKNEEGETAWVETEIVGRVRIRSAATNKFDRRYKVALNLEWEDFEKVVTVTLNDRADMSHPLLIGRNYLRGDFLVDVSLDNED